MDSPKGLSFVHDTALAFRVRDGDPTPSPNQFISQEAKLTDAGGRRPDVAVRLVSTHSRRELFAVDEDTGSDISPTGKNRFGQSGGL